MRTWALPARPPDELSLGAPIVGYSAGEEPLAHTVDESISIEMMADSLRGHVELLLSY